MKHHPLRHAARFVSCTAIGWAALLACASAQPTDPLREAVQRALSTNPQVTDRLNALRASADQVSVARGGLLPRVDLDAQAGAARNRNTANTPETQSFRIGGVALSATQLLWDGLSTYNQIERFDHARLSRYFEFLDASDQTALEAVRAYVDVVRTRELVRLAEDNYVQHRQVAELIQSRVGAGVGRGVDLEQANARLALAETNLSVETANLHDVMERYVRIVGAAPPSLMPLPAPLLAAQSSTVAGLLDETVRKNAAIAASIENLRAVQSQSKENNGLFQPRVEANVRSGAGKNFDGLQSQKSATTAGVTLTWNLFNGGADQARVRQAASLINQAADQRDQACRDARQVASIAFNDTRKLVEQAGYLERNVAATERARDAYRQQFEIGQRSLLDVLNAENELFGSRRSLANANYDLIVARARARAAATSLVATLGLTRGDGGAAVAPAPADWNAGNEAASRCPLAATETYSTPKDSLDSRARYPGTGALAVAGVPTAPQPAMSQPLLPVPAPVAAAGPSPAQLSQRLVDWSAAWSAKDVARYNSFYAPDFKPSKGTRAQWLATRAKLLQQPGPIEVKITDIQRRPLSPTMVETSFDQSYRSAKLKETSHKTVVWQRSGDTWLIVKESGR
jgi:adhesin transport system outer membrane protein